MKKTACILFLLMWLVSYGCNQRSEQAQPEVSSRQLTIADLTTVYDDTLQSNRDQRFLHIRHTDMHYTMPKYETLEDWQKRAEELRTHILVSNGLWPQPEKTPLNPRIFNRIEREDYTVEKIFFESYPNFYVTGNLYKPKGKTPPFPGIVCPHGHWGRGRLNNDERGSVPGRCINFAKQGCVVFSYSMVGYNDSQQLDHKYGADERLNLWGINLMGLQLWNSIRAVDFITSLPEVDVERIGCTGASGGGTQTFMLTAVDERIKVAAPVNMISAHFQGGCLCENAPLLRLDTYNVEIGALAAPRPLIMISATGDWTKNTLENEYPAIGEIYRLFNAEDKIHSVRIDAPHNYNLQSREAVYAWFGRWLLNEEDASKFKEKPFEVEKDEDLLVFAKRSLPPEAVDSDGLTSMLIKDRRAQLQTFLPKDKESFNLLKHVYGKAMKHTLAASMPSVSELIVESKGVIDIGNFKIERLLLGRKGVGDRIPATLYMPKKTWRRRNATLIVHPCGKAALVDSQSVAPASLVRSLLEKGQAVLLIDCFNIGEHVLSGEAKDRSEGYRYFTTFNHTDLALRVQDILTSLAYLDSRKDIKRVNLLGLKQAGLWYLLARSQAIRVAATVVDVAQFDCDSDSVYLEEMYIPNLRRAGDFAVAGALTAPGKLFIHNTGNAFKTNFIKNAYHAAGVDKKLVCMPEKATETELVQRICVW